MIEEESVAMLKQTASVDRIARAESLLPAWFVPRMMTDWWHFGLLLVTGEVLAIENILDVRGSPGNIWIDVRMSKYKFSDVLAIPWPRAYSPTDRTEASVNAAHVAFELAG
jgi:hypothetical protein